MNSILGNALKVSTVVNSLVKNGGCITRGIKSDLKIKWLIPPKKPSFYPEKSGDGGLDHATKPSDFALKFDQSEELKTASDVVKKLFSLEYMPISETEAVNREKARALVRRHEADRGSMESQLAIMTSEILYLQKYMGEHPRNKVAQVFLKELIDRRKKFLGKLRRWDYKKFEWILEKLNLTYHPHPTHWFRVCRKDSMRKLTTKHCDDLRTKRLDTYRSELEAQQKAFFNEKAQRLAFIRAEEIACGVEPTVTEEEINAAQEKAANFNK